MTTLITTLRKPFSQETLGMVLNLAELTRDGVTEIREGLRNWRVWHLLGTAELRRRYARSKLGQGWLVISMGVSISLLGWVWGSLWNMPIQNFIVFFGVSQIFWIFMTGILIDSANAFHSNGNLFSNQYISKSTVIFSVVYRHLILFFHNIVIVFFLVIIFGPIPKASSLFLLIIALFLVSVLALWSGFLLAAMCARFRDIIQIVQMAVQLGFFVTPIIWLPSAAPEALRLAMSANPFFHIIEVLRSPLVGGGSGLSWFLVSLASVGGMMVSMPLVGWLKRRIVYWI